MVAWMLFIVLYLWMVSDASPSANCNALAMLFLSVYMLLRKAVLDLGNWLVRVSEVPQDESKRNPVLKGEGQ